MARDAAGVGREPASEQAEPARRAQRCRRVRSLIHHARGRDGVHVGRQPVLCAVRTCTAAIEAVTLALTEGAICAAAYQTYSGGCRPLR
eukprot:128746-Prymnesium_polylepis.2